MDAHSRTINLLTLYGSLVYNSTLDGPQIHARLAGSLRRFHNANDVIDIWQELNEMSDHGVTGFDEDDIAYLMDVLSDRIRELEVGDFTDGNISAPAA